jgi:hypothetical protein
VTPTTGDRPTPCASFGGAYAKTAPGGEIVCVDSGNYVGIGLSITNSITINCENARSGLSSSTGVGELIIQTTAGNVVVLRGLDIDAEGFGCAISFQGSGVLHVEKMTINRSTNGCTGITFAPTGPAKLFISDSYVTNNGASGTNAGVYVGPASGVEADIVIDRTHIEGNYFGIIFDGTQGGIIHGVIRDSVVSGNTENGITASTTSSNILLLIDQSTVSGNLHGLVAGGANAAIMVRNTTVTGNTAAGLFTVNGGQLFSYGNNRVDGNNGNNGAFTGMATLK